jgi:drug/metabolite transporter (DMT)-like permease
MANTLIPDIEQNATPDEIESIDKRRRWGLTFQVIAGQFAFFAVLLTLWTGQDVTYSPTGVHPMLYYNVLAFAAAVGFGMYGTYLKRGAQEF